MEYKEPVWSGSLTAATRYKLDLKGVQEVSSQKGDTVRAGDYNFFLWKRKRKSSIGNRIFFTLHNYVSSSESRVC